mmetsp:Transcript_27856/g.61529  ORF Transcript_27856/g.61529 Transcript_27856/m.61529 type:complete len:139 (+) Transcript_27856:36-452(+)
MVRYFATPQLRRATKNVLSGQKARNMSLLNADSGSIGTKFHHLANVLLLGLFPVAVISGPSMVSLPIDLALGVLVPAHAHIGINYVISDYVPKAIRGAARFGMVGVTLVTIAGLTRLNLDGVGITESVKSLWRKPKKD